MQFVLIPAGRFMMGTGISADEVQRKYGGKKKWYEREHPQHEVTISRPFYLGKYEVTVGQFRQSVRETGYETSAEKGGGAWVWTGSKWEDKEGIYWDNPGFSQTDRYPVTFVSWNDAMEYIKWLSRKTGHHYRLQTEAEWEYASRAGSRSAFSFGNDAGGLGEYAWYKKNSGMTHPVGQRKPNAWGLYDMHGNVWEWCQDWYDKNYSTGHITDPKGPSSGKRRVFRGGGWSDDARYCRSAYRGWRDPGYRFSIGFRLARAL